MIIQVSDTDYPDPGPRPQLLWLPVNLLKVDHTYQREASSERSTQVINKIAQTFNWQKFQPLTVTPREDGLYSVIDGQHRAAAAAIHPLITEVPCLVVSAPEVRAQARTFMAINRDRVSVNFLQLHHAALAAADPDALHIKDVCDRAGVKVPRNPMTTSDMKPGYTMAISPILKGLKVFGDGPVVSALKILREAYHDVPGQLRSQLVTAMIHFFAMHKGREIDLDRLRRVLREHDAAEMEKSARAYREHFKGTTTLVAIRVALTRAYNKRLPPERQLPEES